MSCADAAFRRIPRQFARERCQFTEQRLFTPCPPRPCHASVANANRFICGAKTASTTAASAAHRERHVAETEYNVHAMHVTVFYHKIHGSRDEES